MSKLELEEEIKREYEENPLLEVEKSGEVDWERYIKNIENSRPSYKNELYYNYDNDINLENIIKNTYSLYENLHLQVSLYKIDKIEKEKQDNEISSARKSQVGSGDRSEKIRTYNYPQGRITDHRIGMSIYQMENFLNGDLDEMIDNLIAADRAEKLKGEED